MRSATPLAELHPPILIQSANLILHCIRHWMYIKKKKNPINIIFIQCLDNNIDGAHPLAYLFIRDSRYWEEQEVNFFA